MKTNLTLNLLPYRVLSESVDLYFTNEAKNGVKLAKKWVPLDIREIVPYDNGECTYWSTESSSSAKKIEYKFFSDIEDGKNRRYLQKRIFTQLLQRHFASLHFIVGSSYVGDARVWIPISTPPSNKNFDLYQKFTIRVDIDSIGKGSGVFLSYDGISAISKVTFGQSGLVDPKLVGKVLVDNQIVSRVSDNFPSQIDSLRFVCNRTIEERLGKTDRYRPDNKYRNYYANVTRFYQDHLSGQSFANCFEILAGGFFEIPDSYVSSVSRDSNLLEFKGQSRNVNVYDGLKNAGGPYQVPDLSKLQFLFVFMDAHKDNANRLFTCLNKGLKNFPGLEKFVSVPFTVDFTKSLRLKTEVSIVAQVQNWLDSTQFDPAKRYFVIYISPIGKDEYDERVGIYYSIKELLLRKDIPSQVVFNDNLTKEAFNFYLPNIAVAILAKLGGIPWRLPFPIRKELVIGIGAFRTGHTSDKFLGNAICFHNDGQFDEFRVIPADDILRLSSGIKESVRGFIRTYGECKRIVIHYYKVLGFKERKILDDALRELELDIPYIFVTVNETESRDYVVFDEDFEGKMPVSGTVVRLRYNEFLLCNNTRYASHTGQKLLGYPFPIKIRITSQPKELTSDITTVQEVIDQIYEFSRIYWKSIKQRNRPVTIEYSEIIAKVVSRFPDQELPATETATKSLWFL